MSTSSPTIATARATTVMCRDGVQLPGFRAEASPGRNWYYLMNLLNQKFSKAGFVVRHHIEADRKMWVLNLHTGDMFDMGAPLSAVVIIEWEENYPAGCLPES